MLSYVMTKVIVPGESSMGLGKELALLFSSMVSQGFLGRQECTSLWTDEGEIVLGGMLSAPESMDAALSHFRAKENWAALCELLVSQGSSSIFHITHSEDDHYCRHDPLVGLELVIDYPWEISPLVCRDCKGIVGRYKVNCADSTAGELWDWESKAIQMYRCWLESGLYESWAESELRDPESEVNRCGKQLAATLSEELAVPVNYRYPLEDLCE